MAAARLLEVDMVVPSRRQLDFRLQPAPLDFDILLLTSNIGNRPIPGRIAAPVPDSPPEPFRTEPPDRHTTRIFAHGHDRDNPRLSDPGCSEDPTTVRFFPICTLA